MLEMACIIGLLSQVVPQEPDNDMDTTDFALGFDTWRCLTTFNAAIMKLDKP